MASADSSRKLKVGVVGGQLFNLPSEWRRSRTSPVELTHWQNAAEPRGKDSDGGMPSFLGCDVLFIVTSYCSHRMSEQGINMAAMLGIPCVRTPAGRSHMLKKAQDAGLDIDRLFCADELATTVTHTKTTKKRKRSVRKRILVGVVSTTTDFPADWDDLVELVVWDDSELPSFFGCEVLFALGYLNGATLDTIAAEARKLGVPWVHSEGTDRQSILDKTKERFPHPGKLFYLTKQAEPLKQEPVMTDNKVSRKYKRTKLTAAEIETFIITCLSPGPTDGTDIRELAEEQGISEYMLLKVAKDLEIVRRHRGPKPRQWVLPPKLVRAAQRAGLSDNLPKEKAAATVLGGTISGDFASEIGRVRRGKTTTVTNDHLRMIWEWLDHHYHILVPPDGDRIKDKVPVPKAASSLGLPEICVKRALVALRSILEVCRLVPEIQQYLWDEGPLCDVVFYKNGRVYNGKYGKIVWRRTDGGHAGKPRAWTIAHDFKSDDAKPVDTPRQVIDGSSFAEGLGKIIEGLSIIRQQLTK